MTKTPTWRNKLRAAVIKRAAEIRQPLPQLNHVMTTATITAPPPSPPRAPTSVLAPIRGGAMQGTTPGSDAVGNKQ